MILKFVPAVSVALFREKTNQFLLAEQNIPTNFVEMSK